MVQNFTQPPSARFAEAYGLPSCDARVSMISNSTDGGSSTAVDPAEDPLRAGRAGSTVESTTTSTVAPTEVSTTAPATESTAVSVPESTAALTPKSVSQKSVGTPSTISSDSQDSPTMRPRHSVGQTILANTSYTGRRFVNWIVQVPKGVTLGLSQAFHEAPRLYGDRMVRDFPKVKGLRSGLVAAGTVSHLHTIRPSTALKCSY